MIGDGTTSLLNDSSSPIRSFRLGYYTIYNLNLEGVFTNFQTTFRLSRVLRAIHGV